MKIKKKVDYLSPKINTEYASPRTNAVHISQTQNILDLIYFQVKGRLGYKNRGNVQTERENQTPQPNNDRTKVTSAKAKRETRYS